MKKSLQTFELSYEFHYTTRIKQNKGMIVEQVAKFSTSLRFGVKSN